MPNLPNLSGSNIQDTYQRVLHTDGTLIYNGTGSVMSILPVTASYAISASHEITYELSSSYAETASMASSNFIVQGNISASGTISTGVGTNKMFGSLQLGGLQNITDGEDYISFSANNVVEIGDPSGAVNSTVLKVDDVNSKVVITTGGPDPFTINAINGNVTSSGNISASGNLIVNEITAEELLIGNDIEISNNSSIFVGTSNTSITANDDDYWKISANGVEGVRIASNGVTINEGGVPQSDFRVESNTDTHAFFIDAGADKVAIGTDTVSDSLLTVDGNITTAGEITASGNISSSGNVYGQGLYANNILYVNGNVAHSGDQLRLSGERALVRLSAGHFGIGNANPASSQEHLIIPGNVTASGIISASAGIITPTLSGGAIGDPSGSLTLSGSLSFNDNIPTPEISASTLFVKTSIEANHDLRYSNIGLTPAFGYASLDDAGTNTSNEILFGVGSAVTSVQHNMQVIHDTTTNGTRIYALYDGVYKVTGNYLFEGSTALTTIDIKVDGTAVHTQIPRVHGSVDPVNRTHIYVGSIDSGSYVTATADGTSLEYEIGSVLMVERLI